MKINTTHTLYAPAKAEEIAALMTVEDQVSAIWDAYKPYRKPGIEYYFHLWADHAPIDTLSDRQHVRSVRAAFEAQGVIFED
jgi:hypothetical protein